MFLLLEQHNNYNFIMSNHNINQLYQQLAELQKKEKLLNQKLSNLEVLIANHQNIIAFQTTKLASWLREIQPICARWLTQHLLKEALALWKLDRQIWEAEAQELQGQEIRKQYWEVWKSLEDKLGSEFLELLANILFKFRVSYQWNWELALCQQEQREKEIQQWLLEEEIINIQQTLNQALARGFLAQTQTSTINI